MKKILIPFLFLLLIISCSKEKKAKDIVIEEVLTPCDCVSSFYLVISEINTLKENQSNIDSFEYINEKNMLESIASSIDEKCIIYEGEDSILKTCVEYENLLQEMDIYGFE